MATKLTAKDKELIQASKEQEEIDKLRYRLRVEDRKRFASFQPVVYQMLDQSLKNAHVSHAYLFSGPKGCFKKEAALLFAQSLILDTKGLVEEETLSSSKQDITRRIADGTYSDYIFFDGYQKEAIGREEILGIQELFSKTSMEESGRKIYVIDHAENMSIAAMNGLLKFLEEPADQVYAILTTDNMERLLPTIVSRCLVVPFRTLSEGIYYDFLMEEGVDAEDAFLLSRLVSNTRGYEDIVASKSYQTAKSMLKQWIGVEGNERLFLVDYEVRYRLKQKDVSGEDGVSVRDANLDVLWMFFGMLIGFYKDVIRHAEVGPTWYSSAIENAYSKQRNYAKLLDIAVKGRDRCNHNNDLNLVLNQAIYEMEAV